MDKPDEKVKEIDQNSDEGTEGEEEESSDEEVLDFTNGKSINNSTLLLKHIQRDLNCLADQNKTKRKFGLMNLYNIFVKQDTKIEKKTLQQVLLDVQKPLLKRFNDPVEKCRELSILIIKKFFEECDDLTITFPYIFPVLVEKLGAYDLDGTDALPDVMKPPPSQKPKMIISPPEQSEEIRLQIAEVVTLIIKSTMTDCFRAYLDDLVNILWALIMDPYGEVIREACEAYYALCTEDPELLHHFTVKMGRSTFLALTHKHAKVRCAGLKALNAIMYWGAWKYTVDLFEALIGFRDPNIVPIKDFYEASIKYNYFARFVDDRSTVVRETFFKTMANWLLKLPDKVDHEGRIIPYMISALNDQNDGIQDLAFELLEEMGMDYEEREEQKVRDKKQYALDAEWTNSGEFVDLDLPRPFKHRPRMGSRIVVRSYTRRYLKAIYRELSDWILENRQRAAHLLLSLVIYTEDYITQYLDHLLLSLYKAILEKEDTDLREKLEISCKLLGRYWLPKVYCKFLFTALSGGYTSPWAQVGALKIFGCLAEGSIEVIPKGADLTQIDECFQRIFDAIEYNLIEPLDFELSEMLVDSLTRIFNKLLNKAEKDNVKISLFSKYERQLFKMITAAFGVFNTHSLFDKDSSDRNKELKYQCLELYSILDKLLDLANNASENDTPKSNIINKWLPVMFYNINKSQIIEWTFQEQYFRIFNAFINNMDYQNSEAIFDESLLKLESDQYKAFLERIDQYQFEKDEEYRKRYNRHLGEVKSSKKKQEELKAIQEKEELENELMYEEEDKINNDEPTIEEEVIETTNISKPSLIPTESTGVYDKVDNEIELLPEESYLPNTSVFNVATNIIFKLFQHPSYDIIKYGQSKISQMIKLNEPNMNERCSNIFKLFTVCLKIKTKDRKQLIEIRKAILRQISVAQRDVKIEINLGSCEAFYEFINQLGSLYDVYNLEIRKDAVKLLKTFIDEYVDFLKTNKAQKQDILKQNFFLGPVFKDLFNLVSVNDDDIREIAAYILSVIVDEFLPDPPIVKGIMYANDILDFTNDLSNAFDSEEKMDRMDQYCRLEKEMIKHVCEDPDLFMQGIVKLCIDETNGATRDIFINIITKMNDRLPFTVMNDFKRANSLGMLKRVELMSKIILQR